MNKNGTNKINPDHKKQISRLRRIKGQVEGIERMILDRRYCPEIVTQLRAASSALKALEVSILETHFHHCVADAFNSKNEADKRQKVKEIMHLFSRS